MGGGRMGNKTHPIGFRLGIIKDWQARWFAAKPGEYRAQVAEDMVIRSTVLGSSPDAGISKVEIERSNEVVVTVHTARPGIVIGRGGQKVEELRKMIESKSAKRVRLNVQEIRQPSWTRIWSHATSQTSWSGESPSGGLSGSP